MGKVFIVCCLCGTRSAVIDDDDVLFNSKLAGCHIHNISPKDNQIKCTENKHNYGIKVCDNSKNKIFD